MVANLLWWILYFLCCDNNTFSSANVGMDGNEPIREAAIAPAALAHDIANILSLSKFECKRRV